MKILLILETMNTLYYQLFKFIRQFYYHLKRILKTKEISSNYSPPLKGLLRGFQYLYIKLMCNKSFRFLFNKNFVSKNRKKFKYQKFCKSKFFYFHLGQIVEGSDPIFSGNYSNDLEALNEAIKKIPLNKKLLFKEHRSMISERPIYQTKLLDSLDGTFVTGKELLDVNNKIKPIQFIIDSEGVLSLSGSCLSEAMLCYKPVFIFGNPWIKLISSKLNFDPWSREGSLEMFFENPEKFIIPKEIVNKIVSLSSSLGFQISLLN